METSYSEIAMEENECRENILPVPNANHNVSTPTSRLTRLEFAPTPFMNYMNIANKCPPPEPLKCGLSPLQDVPRFPFGGMGAGSASSWLYDETLPEITLLDETVSLCSPCDSRKRAPSSSSLPTVVTAVTTTKETGSESPLELSKLEGKGFWLDVKNFPDITLLDMTRGDESPPTGGTTERTETSSADHTPCSQPEDIPVAAETSLIKNPTCSATQENHSSDVQHSATGSRSLQNSSDTAAEATIIVHNNTSECEQTSSSSDNLQKTMEKHVECEQAPAESVSMTLSESSSSDPLQKTMDKHASECEQPPTQSGSTTLSESSSSDNLQKTMEKHVECEQAPAESVSVTLSESSSSDRLQKTMDKNASECEQPPTQTQSVTFSESSSSDNLQKTMDKHTLDCELQPTQTGSITLSESSSRDNLQKTTDRLPSPQICNLTTSLKEGAAEVQLPEQPGTKDSEPADYTKNLEGTFEIDPVLDGSSAAARRETKDHTKSALALTDVYDNSIIHENPNTETNKVNTFNLDETLDLGVESLVTSTPIVNCKVLTDTAQHAEGRNPAAQKKLLGEEPAQPAARVASEGPANIVCDRKTFITRESKVAKHCLPPLKLSSQLLKNKSTSALPGRFQPATSGLPLTRQRAQTEAGRNAASSTAPAPKETTGTSCTYNLRTTTAVSGLRKPQESGIPSGIQRITRGLKMPAARGNAQVPRKLCGPAVVPSAPCDSASRARALKPPANGQRAVTTKSQAPVTNPAPKTIMAKKHPFPRNEAAPSKKLKMDSVVSSSNPGPAASCQRGGPNAQTHVCANCAELEKQNKVMGEEIKRLNKELLKYKEDN